MYLKHDVIINLNGIIVSINTFQFDVNSVSLWIVMKLFVGNYSRFIYQMTGTKYHNVIRAEWQININDVLTES